MTRPLTPSTPAGRPLQPAPALAHVPVIETERLILRAPEAADLAPLAAFYAGPRAGFVGGPLDDVGAWRVLATEIGHWPLRGYGRWTLLRRDSGAVAGLIGLIDPPGWPEPELGWDLFEGHEGQGLAFEAASAVREWTYATLGWSTLISLIAPDNARSAALARRLGARIDGSFTHARHGRLDIWRHPGPEAAP